MDADHLSDAAPASLEVFEPLGHRTIPLCGDVTRLGRAEESHVQILDGHVSKRHAEIQRRERSYVLRDVGSRAGVLCNGVPVTERLLRDGDVILLGRSCSVRIVFHGDAATDQKSDGSVFLSAFSSSGQPDRTPADTLVSSSSGGPSGLQHLARFLELSRTLSGHLTPDEVVESVVDMAIEMTNAERGFVVLVGDDDRLRLEVVRGCGDDSRVATPPTISETIVRQVLRDKAPRVVSNVAMDADLAGAQSVMNLGLGSIAAIPLWRHILPDPQRRATATDEVFGVLCLDSQRSRQAFDAVDLGILEALARDASSAIENARLMRETQEKQRMAAELARAREVQAALVPDSYWSADHFDVAGTYVPCLDLGGDYIGQFRRDHGECSFAVADVCGKGVHAALLAAALQGALLVEFGTDHQLDAITGQANRVVSQIAPVGKFISMLCCSLAPDGTLRYVNAGHCPLILVRANTVEHLVTGGMALGLDGDATYAEHSVQLSPGDTAILYTDGVLEAMNSQRETFGEERLGAAVAASRGQPAADTCARLLAAIEAFRGDEPVEDDTTLLVIRYRGTDS